VAGAAGADADLFRPADRRGGRAATVIPFNRPAAAKSVRVADRDDVGNHLGDDMANTATVRNANGLPATFAGSKTGQDDAPFVFVKVGNEERRMRWAEWDALPAWTGPRPARTAKD
jgi:hypothetical protein